MKLLRSKTLWIGITLLVIAGSWIGNILYYEATRLEQPIFLNQHRTVKAGGYIELLYLENSDSRDPITDIRVNTSLHSQENSEEEIPYHLRQWKRDFSSGREVYFSVEQTYRHQQLKSAIFSLEYLASDTIHEPLFINNIIVYFQSGKSMTVPIGEIVIEWDTDEPVIGDLSVYKHDDGTNKVLLDIRKPVTLTKVEYPYNDNIKSRLHYEFEMNEEPIKPDQLPVKILDSRYQVNDFLWIRYNWTAPDNEPVDVDVYQSELYLHFLLEDGSTVVETVPIDYTPITEEQVKYLRNEGDHHE